MHYNLPEFLFEDNQMFISLIYLVMDSELDEVNLRHLFQLYSNKKNPFNIMVGFKQPLYLDYSREDIEEVAYLD